MEYTFDLNKDLSLWSDAEKDSFIDFTDFCIDFGENLTDKELNIRNDILNLRNAKKTVTLTMNLEIEADALDELKKIEHHADYLLNLDSYPEILSVANVQIKEAS